MNADTADRDHVDDTLMAQVRHLLDEVDAAEAARPTTMPPWARINAGRDRARRRRRRSRAVRLGAGLFALTAAGAATFTGVLPYPSLMPIMTVPGSGGKSALDDGHTRGSLGSDATWLQALRRHVASGPTDVEDGGESWSPPPARDISVLYAADVGEYRLALVEGNWHWGPIGSRQQVWYLGSAGAPASTLVQGASHSPENLVYEVFNPGTGEPGHASTALVVLSTAPIDVRLKASPTIDADGAVHQREQVLTRQDDFYQKAVTAAGLYTLRVGDEPARPPFEATEIDDGLLMTTTFTERGGPMIAAAGDQRAFGGLARQAAVAARQSGGLGGFAVLAAEPEYRGTRALPVRAIVGQLTLPGGARVIAAGQMTGGRADDSQNGGLHESWLDVARLLPAGDSDDVSMAWRIPRVAEAGAFDRATVTGWTAAMGPVGTTSVQWVHQNGTTSTRAARNTLAVIDRDDVRSVRFRNADGEQIGTSDVLDPW